MKKIIAFLGPLSIAAILTAATCQKTRILDECLEKVLKSDCVCYEIYKPVCGCNGKTYPNDCVARCQNITKFKEGACLK
jgi:hypothetical protein